jgi:uncharacterized membrane protein
VKKNKAERNVLRIERSVLPIELYVLLVCYSLVGHALSDYLRHDPGIVAPVASAATLGCGLFAAFQDEINTNRRSWKAMISVAILGLMVELIGLGTGYPFGHYHYTSVWWPSVRLSGIGDFPLFLPAAWLLVVGSSTLASQAIRNPWGSVLLASMIACVVDLAMEGTLAGKMNYWTWEERGPLPGHSPWSNTLSWFGLSIVGSLMIRYTHRRRTNASSPIIVLAGQLLLMVGLRFT